MTADIKKLSDSLRHDTPEKALERDIIRRRSEILTELRHGRTFEVRDPQGRVVKISPEGDSRNNR